MSRPLEELLVHARFEARRLAAWEIDESCADRGATGYLLLGDDANRRADGIRPSAFAPATSRPARVGEFHRRLGVRELIALEGEQFAGSAYWAVLGRDADPQAMKALCNALRQGASKIELLKSLSESDEARKSGRRLPGIRLHLLAERIYKIPVLGYLAQIIVGLARMPLMLREQEKHRKRMKDESAQLSSRILDLEEQMARHQNRLAPISDHFVGELERVFRGETDDVRNRLKIYLRFLPDGPGLTGKALDLGVGRGEWMSILIENGFEAKGVDSNPIIARSARGMGLDVEDGDALVYLKNLGSRTQSLVTAFHVVEHLQITEMLAWLTETLRVLEPGGRIFLETPNPKNLIVGSCNFWLDPTHVRPLPPELLRFSLEYVGFEDVKIVDLHPIMSDANRTDDQPLEAQLAGWVFGPQDYGVIGTKAS